VTFMLRPLPASESGTPRTNVTFLLKIDAAAPEGSWLDWGIQFMVRQIGSLLQSKVEKIVANFDGSVYAQRVKDNPKFYGYIDSIVKDYLERTANPHSEIPANDDTFEFILPPDLTPDSISL